MGTTKSIKISPSKSMQRAALSANSGANGQGCVDCIKKGLAILPVVPTIVPNSIRGKTSELSSLDNKLNIKDLKSHWLVLRTLPVGYLYVYKHVQKTWDAYVVDADGLLHKTAPADCPAQASQQTPMKETCKRKGHNTPAQVIAIDPDKNSAVYMAFSRHRWSAEVLMRYADNVDGCRTKRMAKVDIMAAANGSMSDKSEAHNAVKFGLNMSATTVKAAVADYTSLPTRNMINMGRFEAIQNREGQAKQLAATMANISSATPSKRGVIIALSDELGIATTLNQMRNDDIEEKALVAQKYAYHQFVDTAAKRFKEQCEAREDMEKWNEDYATAYDQAAIDTQLNARKTSIDKIDARLKQLGEDWVVAMKRPGLAPIFAYDFESNNIVAGMECAVAAANCMHGAGTQPAERTLIQAWLNGTLDDGSDIIWRALSGNHKKLIDRLKDPADLMPAGMDVAKSLWGIANDFEQALTKEETALLLRLRNGVKNDAIADGIARLMHVIASNIDSNMQVMGKAASRAIVISALWAGLQMAPVQYSLTPRQAAYDAKLAGWGKPPVARVQAVRQKHTIKWSYDLLEITDVLQTAGGKAVTQTRFEILRVSKNSQWVNVGDVYELVSPDSVRSFPVSASAEAAASNARPQGVGGAGAAVSSAVARLSGTTSFQRSMHVLRNGGGNAILSGGVLIFQVMGFHKASDEMAKGTDGDKALEHSLAYLGAMTGMIGAASELTSATIQASYAARGVSLNSLYNAKRFIRITGTVGGMLGGAAGVIIGFSSIAKSWDLLMFGDDDAASWFFASGVITVASGFAGGIAATSLTLLGIGPVGWAILALGLAAGGIALAFMGDKATDDPIEKWLKRTLVGRADGDRQFSDMAEAVQAYNELFKLPMQVEIKDKSFGVHRQARIHVRAPMLDAKSWVAIDVATVLDGSVTPVPLGSSGLGQSRTGKKDRARYPETLNAGNNRIHLNKVLIREQHHIEFKADMHSYPTQRTNHKKLKSLVVTVRYYPNKREEPTWILPEEKGQKETLVF